MELIACATEGEVRGYRPVSSESSQNLLDINVEQESIRELSQRKHNLLLELKNYEQNQKYHQYSEGGLPMSSVGGPIPSGPGDEDMGVIPAQTQLSTALALNLGTDGKPVR